MDEDIHAWTRRLPSLKIVANEVSLAEGDNLLGVGSFADAYKATWRGTPGATKLECCGVDLPVWRAQQVLTGREDRFKPARAE